MQERIITPAMAHMAKNSELLIARRQPPNLVYSTPLLERALFLLAATASVAAWGVMIARIMHDWHPIMDLASHLSWHVWIGLSAIVFASTMGIRFRSGEQQLRWWHRWLITLPPWVYFTWVTLPWLAIPLESNNPEAQGLKVLSWNIWMENRAIDQVLELIRETDPDVIVIIELGPDQAKALKELENDYPHYLWIPDDTSRGIGMLSRIPGTELKSVDLANQGMPSIEVRIPSGQHHQAMRVMAVHTRSPGLQRRTLMRNSQLQSLAEWAVLPSDPAVIVGDLNITPWSPTFSRLLTQGNLVDTRNFRGYFSSWPLDFGNYGIPIDHVLVSKEIKTKYRSVFSKSPDSDHRPIVAILQ